MTKVEEVARAISRSFHEEGYVEGVSTPAEWNEFLKAARAAIAAMREPTKEMLDAGELANDDGETHGCRWHASASWETMIDAALTDGG